MCMIEFSQVNEVPCKLDILIIANQINSKIDEYEENFTKTISSSCVPIIRGDRESPCAREHKHVIGGRDGFFLFGPRFHDQLRINRRGGRIWQFFDRTTAIDKSIADDNNTFHGGKV